MVGYKGAMSTVEAACDRMVRRGCAAYPVDPAIWCKDGPLAVISIAVGPDNLLTGEQTMRIDVLAARSSVVWLTATIEHLGAAVNRAWAIGRGRGGGWVADMADDRWPRTLAQKIETAVSDINSQKGD